MGNIYNPRKSRWETKKRKTKTGIHINQIMLDIRKISYKELMEVATDKEK